MPRSQRKESLKQRMNSFQEMKITEVSCMAAIAFLLIQEEIVNRTFLPSHLSVLF